MQHYSFSHSYSSAEEWHHLTWFTCN